MSDEKLIGAPEETPTPTPDELDPNLQILIAMTKTGNVMVESPVISKELVMYRLLLLAAKAVFDQHQAHLKRQQEEQNKLIQPAASIPPFMLKGGKKIN